MGKNGNLRFDVLRIKQQGNCEDTRFYHFIYLDFISGAISDISSCAKKVSHQNVLTAPLPYKWVSSNSITMVLYVFFPHILSICSEW